MPNMNRKGLSTGFYWKAGLNGCLFADKLLLKVDLSPTYSSLVDDILPRDTSFSNFRDTSTSFDSGKLRIGSIG